MKAMVLTAFLLTTITSSFAQQRIQIGNMAITGSGLQLIGTVSTTTADEEKGKGLSYLGWGLIIVGSLVNGGNLVIGSAQAQTLSQDDIDSMTTNMQAEAQIVMKDPSLASNLTIQDAINGFEMDADPEVKAQRFAEIAYKVSTATEDIDYSEILGTQDTETNREILERMDFVFGIATI